MSMLLGAVRRFLCRSYARLVRDRERRLDYFRSSQISLDTDGSRHVPDAASRDSEQIFSVSTAYMPKEGERLSVVDPYVHSVQWSRRFIGLKLFLTLATTGWSGYAEVLRHQSEMGDLLRERLTESGWSVLNRTKLPVVCFTPSDESGIWRCINVPPMLWLNPEARGFQRSCWAARNRPCERASRTTEPHRNTSRPSSPFCRVFGTVFQRDQTRLRLRPGARTMLMSSTPRIPASSISCCGAHCKAVPGAERTAVEHSWR